MDDHQSNLKHQNHLIYLPHLETKPNHTAIAAARRRRIITASHTQPQTLATIRFKYPPSSQRFDPNFPIQQHT